MLKCHFLPKCLKACFHIKQGKQALLPVFGEMIDDILLWYMMGFCKMEFRKLTLDPLCKTKRRVERAVVSHESYCFRLCVDFLYLRCIGPFAFNQRLRFVALHHSQFSANFFRWFYDVQTLWLKLCKFEFVIKTLNERWNSLLVVFQNKNLGLGRHTVFQPFLS